MTKVPILDFERVDFSNRDTLKYSNYLSYIKKHKIKTSFITETCHTPLKSIFPVLHKSLSKYAHYLQGLPPYAQPLRQQDS